MDNKQLFKNINNLKNITPDNKWKDGYRKILFSQISCGQVIEINKTEKKNFFSLKIFFGDLLPLLPQLVKVKITRSVWIGGLAIIMLLIGGLVSVYASRNTKPGDSLYIAKIINEKTQFAITFNEEEKTKLNLEFATNRAMEINHLLKKTTATEQTVTTEQNRNQKVQKLIFDFKREVNQAKDRLNKIDKIVSNQTSEEDQFFSANLNRDNQRMEISKQIKTQVSTSELINPQSVKATTTIIENLIKDNPKVASEILEEAEKLFDDKEYNKSIDKLQEVNTAIEQTKNKEDQNNTLLMQNINKSTTTVESL
ncbi:hypothetical protein KKH16_02100 [Patescibacteria group bacterium]|nr:hypothetical protein [Patescibacteria group bacterium]MBU1870789.1 hypothetical protein [Patescibacteria group bacterium]